MIIFYNKKTGIIIGTIDGRIHPKEHLDMWIGDKKDTSRIIVNWKPVRFYDEKGGVVKKKDVVVDGKYIADFEPIHPQKNLFMDFDNKKKNVYDYKINTKTKKLISNNI